MRTPARFSIKGDQSIRRWVVGAEDASDPVLKAGLKGLGLQSDQQSADTVAGGNAAGQGENLMEPIGMNRGPAMDGGGAITATEDTTDRDDDDVREEVFAIAGVAWVRQRLEVTTDGADIN